MVQQAMVQVLQPIFEQKFSDSSYGFRPIDMKIPEKRSNDKMACQSNGTRTKVRGNAARRKPVAVIK